MKSLLRTTIFLLLLSIIALTGCGRSTSEKAFWDGLKKGFSDSAESLDDPFDIEYALVSNNWAVRAEQRSRQAELIRRMISKKGFTGSIVVEDAFYDFNYKGHHGIMNLDISAYCNINGEYRWLFINCGDCYVESNELYTEKTWYLSLRDKDSNDVQEPWAWCYYDKSEIEDTFWRPTFTHASENYMYLDSGVYLHSI